MRFLLEEVLRLPKMPAPGILYWSREYEMSAHVCACGCGDVIYLPVDPANYIINVSHHGVTLRPSVGNWGVCDAHYLITDGKVEWARKWSPEQIARGRAHEDARRAAYYAPPKRSWHQKVLARVRRLLRLR